VANDWEAIRRYHLSYRIDGVIIAGKEEFERRKAVGQGKLFETPDLDIAYNFGIEEEAGTLKLRIGRPLTMPGAHCREGNQNNIAIGICCVGNYDQQPLDDGRFNFLVDLCLSLCLMFGISPGNIHGHRDYAPYKTCPGKNINPVLIGQTVEEELRAVSRRISVV
jgi:hypothetical protein